MPTKSSKMTYATVCSGIECMSAAIGPLGGWEPVFFSEIEPFPCALLEHRYPEVPNLGDMTKIKAERIGEEEKWRITNGTTTVELDGRLDVFAGGTPCTDVSVAGLRKGMALGSGTRSSLAFEFARLCRELQPRWVVWENVPGIFTSNGGRDFAHFLDTIGECGYSLAYRTLDAQYVRVDGLPRAVPQRRRRCWLVGHLGDDWHPPCEVLFEPQGVRGDTPPRRVTGKGFAGEIVRGPEGADRPAATSGCGGDVISALTATDLEKRLTGQADRGGNFVITPSGFDPYEPGGVKTASKEVAGSIVCGSSPGFHNAVCFENHQTDARTTEVDVAPTIGATRNAQTANNNPLVVTPASEPVAYTIDSMGSNAMKSKNPHSGCREVECAPTLTTVDSAPVKHQGGTAVVAFLPGNSANAKGVGAEEEVSPTLVKCQGESGNKVAIASECVGVFDMGARKTGAGTDTTGASPTILTAHGTDPHAVCIGFDAQMGKMNTQPKDNLSETLATCHQCGVAVGFHAHLGTHGESPKEEVSSTLAKGHKCGVAIGLDRASFNQGKNAQFGFKIEEECAATVIAKGPGAVATEEPAKAIGVGFDVQKNCPVSDDVSPTLHNGSCPGHKTGVMSFEPGLAKREGNDNRFVEDAASTLRAKMGDNLPAVAVDYIVRRLTPLECERLQGLPDGYTKIPYRGKSADECPDTPRYKALGNGWAVNCARWICQRIQNYDKEKYDGNEE